MDPGGLLNQLPQYFFSIRLLPYLSLYDVVHLSEVSKCWYALIHHDLPCIPHEVHVTGHTDAIDAIRRNWNNVQGFSFQPALEAQAQARDVEETIYDHLVPLTPNLMERQVQELVRDAIDNAVEAIFPDMPRAGFRFSPRLKELVQMNVITSLNLSGAVGVRFFPGAENLDHVNLSGCSNLENLQCLFRPPSSRSHTSSKKSLTKSRSLDLSYCSDLVDLSAFRLWTQERAKKVQLTVDGSYCHAIVDCSALANCHTVSLNMCKGVTDISALVNVHTLSCRNCPQLRNLTPPRRFSNVRHLTLSGCRELRDVSALGKCDYLNLSTCPGIRDVSALGQVRHLVLRKCTQLRSIRGLTGNVVLDCSGCVQVSDFPQVLAEATALRECHLSGCSQLTHVPGVFFRRSNNNHCKKLNLSNCAQLVKLLKEGLIDFPKIMTTSLTELNLSNCKHLRDVSSLGHVGSLETLVLSRCVFIEDVSMLGHIPYLDLSGCPRITNVSALGRVKTLNLYRCLALEDVSMLGNIQESLSLSSCPLVQNVSALGWIPSLDLRFCDSVRALHFEPPESEVQTHVVVGARTRRRRRGLRRLSCAGCLNLRDVSSLGQYHALEQLDLSYCKNLTDVSALGHVRKLTLKNCTGVRDISALERVQKLDLTGCSVTR